MRLEGLFSGCVTDCFTETDDRSLAVAARRAKEGSRDPRRPGIGVKLGASVRI
jgi:hypothetical protein